MPRLGLCVSLWLVVWGFCIVTDRTTSVDRCLRAEHHSSNVAHREPGESGTAAWCSEWLVYYAIHIGRESSIPTQRSIASLLDDLTTRLLGLTFRDQRRQFVHIKHILRTLLVRTTKNKFELFSRNPDGLKDSGDSVSVVN